MLLSIFLSGFSSAISTDMKSTYAPAETMIIKISGNIVDPLSVKQVQFIRAGNVQEVPMTYDLKKLGDTYYLWAIAPKSINSYTLVVKDVSTTVAGTPAKIEFRQNFSVSGNLTAYSISPGFILADREFQIQVQLYTDEPKSISTNFPKERSVSLQPGTMTVMFPFENVVGTQVRTITFGTYTLPAYLVGGSLGSSSGSALDVPLSFAPTLLSRTLSLNQKNKSILFNIVNTGKEEISKIRMTYDSTIFSLSPEGDISLKPGESETYSLTPLKNDGIRIQEQISARSGEWNIVLPLRIDFIQNRTDDLPLEKNVSDLYRCSEFGGNICTDKQTCTGTINISQEGNCCIGICKNNPSDGGTSGSTVIGYLLAVLVVLGLGYLYWKYKKTRAETNPLPRKIKEAEKNIP